MVTLGSIALSYLFEARKKRKLETYWKIEAEYKAQEISNTTKYTLEIMRRFSMERDKNENIPKAQMKMYLMNYYKLNYDDSIDPETKDKALLMRTRLRFYHLCGVLLRKKMVDRDMLFYLIGSGLKIGYDTLKIIVDARRDLHGDRYLYNHFEFLWVMYQRWKKQLKNYPEHPLFNF